MLLLHQVWSAASHFNSTTVYSQDRSETLITILCLCIFQESVATKNVPSCTSIQSPKSKTAPGTTEASANTVGAKQQLTCFHTNTEHKAQCLLWVSVSGPDCRHRHTRRVICVNYLVGFCPEGKSCKFMQYVITSFILHHGKFLQWSLKGMQIRTVPILYFHF